MVPNVRLILLVFALVLFVVAAFPPAQPAQSRIVAAGLAFLTAAWLFGG